MHAHATVVYRSSASVRLCDSFVNLDSCVEDGFFLFFGVWIRRIGPIFPFPDRNGPDEYAYDA